MDYLLLATGFTGAFTLLFLYRKVHHFFRPPSLQSVHFSPQGGCTDAIVAEIKQARHEVMVLACSFTSRPIAQALVDAKKRGVQVQLVLDHSNEEDPRSELQFFLDEGLAPLIDPHHASAHNKVMLIDKRTIISGSFNFTNQAEHENAENVLVLKHFSDLVHAYRANFTAHKDHARAAEVKVKTAPALRQAA